LSQLAHAPEAEATATLFEQYHSRIHAYCLGQLRNRDEADDAVQSTFLYAFALIQRGQTPRAELPWLYTIAHNVCRTRRRSLKRRSRVETGVDLETLHETIGRNDPPREDLAGLDRSLAELPETQRRALLLREWQGLSYAEIASRMEMTDSAVEAVLFRARRNLAQKLRAAQHVASLASGVFLLRGVRRLSPFTGAGKATAAAVAVGVAAGVAVHPPHHAPTTPRTAAQPAAIAQLPSPVHTTVAAPHPRRTVPTRTEAAVPAAATLRQPATPDAGTTESPAPSSTPPAALVPAANAPTELPAASPGSTSAATAEEPTAAAQSETTQPSSVVELPAALVPPAVQDAVDQVVDALPQLPQLPDVKQLVPALPSLPPPPDLSPKGTPLQVGP
jgi:RNA polymerase sigma factor (sigma-70 family)